MIRIIVAGGRDFNDYNLLSKTMNEVIADIDDDITIVCGMAKGADTLGQRYADEHGIPVHYYPADWDKNGKKAGFMRNEVMAQNADMLVAFWDLISKGTKHMIKTAGRNKLKVNIVLYKGGNSNAQE